MVNKDKPKNKVLEEYIGLLGVIIALVMTIAWDFIKTNPENDMILLASVWYYLFCLGALASICVYYYFRYIEFEKGVKRIEEAVFVPFSFIAIVLGIIPIIGSGPKVVNSFILFSGIIIFAFIIGIIIHVFLSKRKGKNDGSDEIKQE